MKKYKFLILANENPDDHELWVKACLDLSDMVEFSVLDLTRNDWLEKLRDKSYDYLLAKPPGVAQKFKQLYDERIRLISEVMHLPVYPSPEEIYIYENKRYLYSWLKVNEIPHPRTDVFYHLNDALRLIETVRFPLVGKTNIGASGSGVTILHNRLEAIQYVKTAFTESGTKRRWGPNLSKGGLIKRGLKYLTNFNEISKKIDRYKSVRADRQNGFVILQEFVPHSYEWRVVYIGGSFFAHKKLMIGEKASGSLLKSYDTPPLELFDFVKSIVEKHCFLSQAVDIFISPSGEYLVNEMQCIFGQSDSYQMLVDGKEGRYSFVNGSWLFDAGMFNSNQSYNLRVEHVIKLLDNLKENKGIKF